MKNLLLYLFTLCSLTAAAQQDELDNVRDPRARERIRAAHAAYITERLELTSAEAEKFWPVYREYLDQRRDLRMKHRESRRAETNEKKLLQLDLDVKQQELDLEKSYTSQLEKIISAEKLVKLRQAEIDFRRLVLRQIQERRRPRR